MTNPVPIRRRSLPDRIRYFATQLTERAATSGDMDLASLAIALGVVALDAEQETAPAASEDGLRERYAAAMREHYLITNRDEADADGNMPCRCGDWREGGDADEYDWDHHLAEAVLAVRDRRMEQLAAGRATWKAKAEEIEQNRDRLIAEQEQYEDQVVGTFDEQAIRLARRAEQAEAAVERARAYAHELRHKDAMGLLAALDGPAATEPADRHGHATVTTHITAPDQANADQWAATIRDLVHAEHGEHMQLHITINPEEQQ